MDKIGKEILLPFKTTQMSKAVKVWVKIHDYKKSYGKHRFLVKPLKGDGEVWVEINARYFKQDN